RRRVGRGRARGARSAGRRSPGGGAGDTAGGFAEPRSGPRAHADRGPGPGGGPHRGGPPRDAGGGSPGGRGGDPAGGRRGVTPEEAEELFARTGAMLTGHFLLSSGRHSDRYVQKARVLEDPVAAMRLAREIASWFDGVEAVVAPAVGAIALGFAVASV